MIRLVLLIPAFCFVLFGAHLMFHGWGLYVSLLTLIPAVLVFLRNRWCRLFCVVLLVCAGVEWVYTAFDLAMMRQAHGLPWMRATLIIGSCAVLTWFSAALLFWKRLDANKVAQREEMTR